MLSVLLRLSLFDRFFNFTRGVIDTKDVVYFLLFVTLFFLLTLLSLGSRKWRGLP
jgi:ABC-2 type transport system permease protein